MLRRLCWIHVRSAGRCACYAQPCVGHSGIYVAYAVRFVGYADSYDVCWLHQVLCRLCRGYVAYTGCHVCYAGRWVGYASSYVVDLGTSVGYAGSYVGYVMLLHGQRIRGPGEPTKHSCRAFIFRDSDGPEAL